MAQLIELTNRSGLDYLQGMLARAKDFRPVLTEIGVDMTESTIQRFNTATAPDGTPWAVNSAATLARYSGLFARKKDGTLKKKDQVKIANKKPLTAEGTLGKSSINSQILSENAVGIGSTRLYAAMQQFGGKKSDFPHLWGNIPARPFLGASEADKTNIADLVRSYILGE